LGLLHTNRVVSRTIPANGLPGTFSQLQILFTRLFLVFKGVFLLLPFFFFFLERYRPSRRLIFGSFDEDLFLARGTFSLFPCKDFSPCAFFIHRCGPLSSGTPPFLGERCGPLPFCGIEIRTPGRIFWEFFGPSLLF